MLPVGNQNHVHINSVKKFSQNDPIRVCKTLLQKNRSAYLVPEQQISLVKPLQSFSLPRELPRCIHENFIFLQRAIQRGFCPLSLQHT